MSQPQTVRPIPTSEHSGRSDRIGRTAILDKNDAVLVVMLGLPGTGKSSVANAISAAIDAPVYSVDPIENAILTSGFERTEETGLAAYRIVELLVEDQLRNNRSAIVDAVNGFRFIRDVWTQIATRLDADIRFIKTVCSDDELHKRRLRQRDRGMHNSMEPSWDQVFAKRETFEEMNEDVLILDAVNPLPDNIATAIRFVNT